MAKTPGDSAASKWDSEPAQEGALPEPLIGTGASDVIHATDVSAIVDLQRNSPAASSLLHARVLQSCVCWR